MSTRHQNHGSLPEQLRPAQLEVVNIWTQSAVLSQMIDLLMLLYFSLVASQSTWWPARAHLARHDGQAVRRHREFLPPAHERSVGAQSTVKRDGEQECRESHKTALVLRAVGRKWISELVSAQELENWGVKYCLLVNGRKTTRMLASSASWFSWKEADP